MKKIASFLILSAIALVCMGTVSEVQEPPFTITTETLTLSANAAAVSFDGRVCGSWLNAIEIYASADDAVTFTINSALGTELYTTTTTGATSGEIEVPTQYWPIPKNRIPTYTLSGLGSGTVTIDVTFSRK